VVTAIANDHQSSALVATVATNGTTDGGSARGRQLTNNAVTQRSTSMNPSMRMGTQSMHSYHKPVNMVMMVTPNRHAPRGQFLGYRDSQKIQGDPEQRLTMGHLPVETGSSLSDEQSTASSRDPTGGQLEQEIVEHISTRSMTAEERLDTCGRLLNGVERMNDELVNLLRYLRSTSRVVNL